jgi:hypothetical protein
MAAGSIISFCSLKKNYKKLFYDIQTLSHFCSAKKEEKIQGCLYVVVVKNDYLSFEI